MRSAAQQAFNMAIPITGVLFSSGACSNGTRVDLTNFRTLLLETELGFRVGETITTPLESVVELRERVNAVFPMIELADHSDQRHHGCAALEGNVKTRGRRLAGKGRARFEGPDRTKPKHR